MGLGFRQFSEQFADEYEVGRGLEGLVISLQTSVKLLG
jgi:hypothetical protein